VIEALLILVALLLVVACGAFVAAGFAFVTVDRPSVERAAQAGDRQARGVRSVRCAGGRQRRRGGRR
jgi:CBS domain containing-hemolysin-like protein